MPNILEDLILEEVSLVDVPANQCASLTIFKRFVEGEHMEDETKVEDTEKGYGMPKEDKVKMDDDMDDLDDMEEMDDDMDDMGDKPRRPTRKSYKAEAQALSEEVETLKAKIAELEVAAIEKAAPEEMVDVGGEMVAKSAIPAPVLKQLEELKKAHEAEELRKRAQETLPNFKGTADQRGKLLKSIGDDQDLLAMLLAADALFGQMFEEVGKTDAANDLKAPAEKLNDLVKAYQEEKKEKDFHKAYAAVIKTEQGRSLVLETYKK
jgi:hypothetical protein